VRIVVAMSGGVDSSVAAALIQQEGYEVIGVSMQIWPSREQDKEEDNFGVCCGLSAIEDAREVAYKLGIPHYAMDFRDIFEQKVITDFCRKYSLGRTPNPCIRCNRYIKFDALLNRAKGLGATLLATGHHARVEKDGASNRYLLKKGRDSRKDQSYVLYALTQEQLRYIRFPIGNFTKEQVRKIARELALPVAGKPESQEICFIPDDDYPKFLREYMPEAITPGTIVDEQGNILGKHLGIPFYTVGQRRGLGISAREPLYVIAIDPKENTIVVGNKERVYGDELIASDLNWIAIAELKHPIRAKAKIRYLHQEAEAKIIPLDADRVHVKFGEPQMAITPGQAVVFYDEDMVIGGGTIERSLKSDQGETMLGKLRGV